MLILNAHTHTHTHSHTLRNRKPVKFDTKSHCNTFNKEQYDMTILPCSRTDAQLTEVGTCARAEHMVIGNHSVWLSGPVTVSICRQVCRGMENGDNLFALVNSNVRVFTGGGGGSGSGDVSGGFDGNCGRYDGDEQ